MTRRTTWKAHAGHSLNHSPLRSFRGRTMQEALQRARAALGPDLWVLSSSRPSKPWPRLLGGDHAADWYEVEVAVELAPTKKLAHNRRAVIKGARLCPEKGTRGDHSRRTFFFQCRESWKLAL